MVTPCDFKPEPLNWKFDTRTSRLLPVKCYFAIKRRKQALKNHQINIQSRILKKEPIIRFYRKMKSEKQHCMLLSCQVQVSE